MRFPFTEVRPGHFRPIIPVLIRGPTRAVLTDGLLDTGADRTLLPPTLARSLGIDFEALTTAMTMVTAAAERVACKTVLVILELARNSRQLTWQAEVAVARHRIERSHWGFKGFLEYFRAEFDGPNLSIKLIAGKNLPRVTPPV